MAEDSTEELPSVEDLMQRIAENYESLPRQLKSVATYIEQHRASVMMDRTSDIAASCGVHPSAVVRFAQRFGFSGFSDLQAVFRQAYTGQGASSPSYQQRIRKLIDEKPGALSGGSVAREFIAASRGGLEELEAGLDDKEFDAAVKMLQHADNIYVVGVRRSFPVASYIVYALQHTPKRVHLVSGFGGMYREQIRSVRKGDVVIAISFAPVREGNAVLPASGASPSGEDARDYRQSVVAARALRHHATLCEGGERVRVPLADQHDLFVPGAVYRACVQAGIKR